MVGKNKNSKDINIINKFVVYTIKIIHKIKIKKTLWSVKLLNNFLLLSKNWQYQPITKPSKTTLSDSKPLFKPITKSQLLV